MNKFYASRIYYRNIFDELVYTNGRAVILDSLRCLLSS